MAESISEVFIRFGTQGVGDVMRQMQALERISKEMSVGVADARESAVSRAMAYSAQEADAEIANTLRSFRVRQETKEGELALRHEKVERAIAYSDAELESELRNTRKAIQAAELQAEVETSVAKKAADEIKAMRADVAKTESEERLRAAAITRQQETAQETFNRKTAEYINLRKSGAISEETFSRAMASANRELEHNVQLHAMGKRGILGSREAMVQLSYALQDAAITWDQGLGRAMQASANNFGMIIPMMTKSIGLGMGLSVGFTALATAISMWERSSRKAAEETDRLNKSLSDLPAVLNKIAEAQKNMLSMRDLLFEGSASSLESAARSKGREAALAREQSQAAERTAGDIGARMTAEATGGGFRGNVMNLSQAEEYREKLQKEIADRIRRNVTVSGQTGRPSMDEEQIQASAVQQSAAAVRALQDQIAATEEYQAALQESNNSSAEAARLTREQKEAQKAHIEAVNQEIYALEKEERAKRKAAEAADKAESGQNRREAVNRIDRGLMSDQQRAATDIFSEFQRNVEAIAGSTGMSQDERSSMLGKASELFQSDLAKLEKDDNKRRFQPGFSGFSDFGKQFQMSLFQDPAEKDRKEQIRLQKEANDLIRQMADNFAGGLPGVATFAAGSQ